MRRSLCLAAGILALAGCRGKERPPAASSGHGGPAPEPVLAPVVDRPPDPATTTKGAGDGAPAAVTLDSLPQTARIALRFDARAFVPYRADEYDPGARAGYRLSEDDGLFVVRANLQGRGRTDYVVAGRDGGQRSVMAVMRRPDRTAWTVQNVTQGEIGTRAPQDSASLWIARAPGGHPNGDWDAVIVRRLYAQSPQAEEIYYWDAERKGFFAKRRSP